MINANDIKIFENALDKACKILADMAQQSHCCINDCPSESKKDCHVKCEDKDAWKAYLLGYCLSLPSNMKGVN